jgi:thioredoxin-dependent peroxiredoxin
MQSMPVKELQKGDKALMFCLPDQNGREVCLEDYKGKWVVLYFYPKDNTSGCTMEAKDFSGAIHEFEKLDAVILGVSPDSTKSHQSFCSKYNLKITLLSDPEHNVLEKYGVWQLKKMYGREYYGVVRSTFLINPEGKIEQIWRKVKVEGHAEEVKEMIKK